MTKTTKGCLIVVLVVLGLIGLMVTLVDRYFKSFQHLEIQVRQTKPSPDGKWTAVVQREIYDSFLVTVPVYAVRLKGPDQKDPMGDLVIGREVINDSSPSIDWSGGKLIVTLAADQKGENLAKDPQKSKMFLAPKLEANPVNGVPIDLRYDEPRPTTTSATRPAVTGSPPRKTAVQ